MQRLTRKNLEAIVHKLFVLAEHGTLDDLAATIHFIIEQWMPQELHVGTYLMGSASLKFALHERYVAQVL